MYSPILKSCEFINNLKTVSSRLIKNSLFIWRGINENFIFGTEVIALYL